MESIGKYYEHSGTIGLLGPVFMCFLGVVGALVLGVIYGYAICYIPFIYLNFFITLGFGAGVGFLVGIGGKLGKVRNSGALLLLGFLFGLFAEYVGWVSWIYAFSEQEALVLLPSGMLTVVRLVAENGAWSIFGSTPTGAALYAIWGIEAVMIVGTSTLVAWAVLSSVPFCERCHQWIETEESIGPLDPVADPGELKSQLEDGDYTMLTSLQKKDAESDVFTQIKLLHCPTCEQNHFLTVKTVAVSVGSDNEEKREENDIVENLIITSNDYTMIKEQW